MRKKSSKSHWPYDFLFIPGIKFLFSKDFLTELTLRRPKKHRSQAPDVPDLAQTVKPWSDLFKIFTDVFARA